MVPFPGPHCSVPGSLGGQKDTRHDHPVQNACKKVLKSFPKLGRSFQHISMAPGRTTYLFTFTKNIILFIDQELLGVQRLRHGEGGLCAAGRGRWSQQWPWRPHCHTALGGFLPRCLSPGEGSFRFSLRKRLHSYEQAA